MATPILKINTFPNYWSYCMSDHAAATRLTPIDAHRTRVRQYWMTHRDAEEGRDYDLERMKYVALANEESATPPPLPSRAS